MWSTLGSSRDMAGWSASQLREWAEGLDESRAPRDVKWWSYAYVTSQGNAYDAALADEARREWAAVFLLIVDCMERFAARDRWAAAAERFNMRAYLIHHLGQVDGSATWNADTLAHDILAMLTLSPRQAREQAEQWPSLPIDQIRALRHHKNVLAPLTLVAHLLGPTAEAGLAREWLALRPQLP
jgi:hypothetical protein